ncbi:MAG: LamG-like jellyroll fold domain-containing protein [Flavobacteriales bacterium]|jgi:hypothetical protein
MFKHLQLLGLALCALLVIPAAAQVPSHVPTDGLVGWWPFNGNANDESGNGNDGVVNGAALVSDRNGAVNSSYEFFGGQWISINHDSLLNFNGDFSILAWINADSIYDTPGYIKMIVSKHVWGANDGYTFNLVGASQDGSPTPNEGILNFAASPNFNPSTLPDSELAHIGVNLWYQTGMTYEASSQILCYYINGQLVDSLFVSFDFNESSSSLIFGAESYDGFMGGTNFFNGSLDDIAIYNRALTEQEIQNLYTGQCPTVSSNCSSLPSNLQQGLVGYWPFCGNANDESGNGNDGVVNGATLTEDRFGNAGAAYGFDGVDDYIEVAYNSTLNLPLAITLSAWFQADTLASMRIIDKSTVGGADGFLLDIGGNNNNKYIRAILAGQSNNQPSSSEFISETNTWYNIIVTYDGIAVRFYVNNELDTTLDISGESLLNSLPLRFGANSLLIDNFFDGVIDDIGIWNRALTPEEVQELYTLDACTFTVYDTLTVYETVYDTVYTYETIYDTVTTYVTVTDTLLIDITFVGFEGQPSWLNTVTVFPNPASDHITIDYGNFALMAGYSTVITDAAGATVYSSSVNSQQVEIDINAWGATGVYYMMIYDSNGVMVAVRHIVLE